MAKLPADLDSKDIVMFVGQHGTDQSLIVKTLAQSDDASEASSASEE